MQHDIEALSRAAFERLTKPHIFEDGQIIGELSTGNAANLAVPARYAIGFREEKSFKRSSIVPSAFVARPARRFRRSPITSSVLSRWNTPPVQRDHIRARVAA